MTDNQKIILAVVATWALFRFLEAREAPRMPLGIAFKPKNLLKTITALRGCSCATAATISVGQPATSERSRAYDPGAGGAGRARCE